MRLPGPVRKSIVSPTVVGLARPHSLCFFALPKGDGQSHHWPCRPLPELHFILPWRCRTNKNFTLVSCHDQLVSLSFSSPSASYLARPWTLVSLDDHTSPLYFLIPAITWEFQNCTTLMLSSSSLVDRYPVLSSETLQALKHYKYEVATYTLRQWNNAKIESERKERDRRRRRADLLAQRAATAAADTKNGSPMSTPSATANQRHHTARGTSDSSSSDPRRAVGSSGSTSVAGVGLGKQRTSTKENGPLMMVSRRRSERSHTTITQAPSASYGAGSAHLPGPAPVLPQNPRHHTTAPVVQSTIGKRPQHPANEPHQPRHQRHKSHSPVSRRHSRSIKMC